MISCNQIKKTYDSGEVLADFTYKFKDTGFYLLFGESGSGKTTLLNILAGHISYDEGTIDINGMEYKGQVSVKNEGELIDYITQDANFIDYLSVYDNLALCTQDEALIDKYLAKFSLMDKKNLLPSKLSGGEKQRVCLIRSLVQRKKIILLDEPTAALDKKNKKIVFETLQMLKDEVLIICSSHDEVAKDYADEYLDFNSLNAYSKNVILENEHKAAKETNEADKNSRAKKRGVSPYIRKWFSSSHREKGSRIKLGIIMVLAFLAVCMGDTPENKFRSSIEYIYGLNQLTLWIDADKLEYMESLYDREDVEEIVLQYENSVPYDDNGVMVEADYEMAVWTLPEKQESLHIDDYLAYGRYIENDNEIILSDAMASRIGEPAKLIGQTLQVKLYGGTYDMTIVGVFSEFTDVQKEYMANSRITVYEDKDLYDERYAISASFTNKFLDDEKFVSPSGGGQRCYIIYFDSYDDMMEFYEEYEKGDYQGYLFTPPYVDLSTEHVFSMMNQYMMPVALLIILLAVVFYFQTQKTEIMYNMKIFAVYQYLGYSITKVKLVWMIYSILEIIKIYAVSGISVFIITFIINHINRLQKFIPFEIFTYNTKNIITLLVMVIAVGGLNAFFMLRRIRTKTISKNLVEQRDIL